jgi:hypothetical protein
VGRVWRRNSEMVAETVGVTIAAAGEQAVPLKLLLVRHFGLSTTEDPETLKEGNVHVD